MNPKPKNQALTFGEFVAGVYDACGKKRATGIVRLAFKANLVEFCGRQRFAISSRPPPRTKDLTTLLELPGATAAVAPTKGQAIPPRHILVVDEDRDLCRLYADALTRPGYCVDAAEDGAAGWAALQASRYHLLITENDLPNLTGVELVRKLRAARMALPVVMAAERLPAEELVRNPSLQLAATLLKPFTVDALLDTVTNVLRATENPREQTEPLPTWQTHRYPHR